MHVFLDHGCVNVVLVACCTATQWLNNSYTFSRYDDTMIIRVHMITIIIQH